MVMRLPLIPLDQELLDWLQSHEDIWMEVKKLIQATGNERFLPLQAETVVREHLSLDECCRDLLSRLKSTSNGLDMEAIEKFDPDEGKEASERLIQLGLAHWGTSTGELKAANLAFDERALFLVGAISTW